MKKSTRSNWHSPVLPPTWPSLCTVTFFVLTAGHSMAQDTWDGGGGDGLWSNSANWLDNTTPSGSAGILTFAGNVQNSTNNGIAGLTTGAVNFTNNGVTATNAFTLAGNAITLGGTVTMTSVTAGPAITDTINLGLIFNGNRTFSTNANHNLTIGGLISETGGARNLTKGGGATLTLSNSSNSFTGQLIVDNGTVLVNGIAAGGTASAMGAGSVFRIGSGANNFPTLTFTSGATSNNRQLQVGNGGVGSTGGARLNNNTANGSGALIFTNTNFNVLDAASVNSRTLILGGTNTDANSVNGIIANNNTAGGGLIAVNKEGVGTWTLGGANTYTGATNVLGGKLVLNGNISTSTLTTVALAGTLSGTGTSGKTVVNGTLAVGNSPGKMDFTDTLALNGSTIMEIDGTAGVGITNGHDMVNLTGAGAAGVLTYGGTLTLDLGVIFGAGTYSWNLFDMLDDTGTFSAITLTDQYSGSLLDGDLNGIWDLSSGSNTWQFTETTGVLGLTVVPEPQVALLGGLSLLALLRRRRA